MIPSMGLFVFIAVIFFVILLAAERLLLLRARKQFSLVIHVNGTRGKSTVTRMIHALLRSQGMEVFGKTTGSAARFLLPDGSEKPVLRLGPANVREQRNMMLFCAFHLKRGDMKKRAVQEKQQTALVFECNAIHEELQIISAQWLKPDITVITNVREDHVRELGTVEQAARAFAGAIPKNSALVTSAGVYNAIWENAAKQKKLKLLYTDSFEAANTDFPENTACVLKVADYMGIDRDEALKAIALHTPDTGAFGVYSWKSGERAFVFADARAANDIESSDKLIASVQKTIKQDTGVMRILMLISREDRPDRTWRFLQYMINPNKETHFDFYLCMGHSPLSLRRTLRRAGIRYSIIRNLNELDSELAEIPGQMTCIFAVGNYCGSGALLTQWLEAKHGEAEFSQIPVAHFLGQYNDES